MPSDVYKISVRDPEVVYRLEDLARKLGLDKTSVLRLGLKLVEAVSSVVPVGTLRNFVHLSPDLIARELVTRVEEQLRHRYEFFSELRTLLEQVLREVKSLRDELRTVPYLSLVGAVLNMVLSQLRTPPPQQVQTATVPSTEAMQVQSQQQQQGENIPEFIKDNPWVTIIAQKRQR